MVHPFNVSTWESEVCGFLSAWGQPSIQNKFGTARIVIQKKPCLKRQKQSKKEFRKHGIFEFCRLWHYYKESESVDSGACHLRSPLPISVSCGLCWVLSLDLSCIFCGTKIRKQNKRFPLVIVKINCILTHMNCSEEGLTLAGLLSWSRSYSEVFDLLIH